MGAFPPGWAEWNDKFRDTVRDYWNHGASAGMLSPRMCGSSDLFEKRGRKPWASVNFVTAHDGFTLHDLVSYSTKHNEANGEDNADGHSDNRSNNYGVEGESAEPAVVALRLRQMRNLLATLLWAQGTPMLLAGDEFARTQQGNNNAYAQNNEISWVDWQRAEEHGALIEFVRRAVGLRREIPELRQTRFLHGEPIPDVGQKDVLWVGPAGEEIVQEQWNDLGFRAFGMLLGAERSVLIIFNPTESTIQWTLPQVMAGARWESLIESGDGTSGRAPADEAVTVEPRTVRLLRVTDVAQSA